MVTTAASYNFNMAVYSTLGEGRSGKVLYSITEDFGPIAVKFTHPFAELYHEAKLYSLLAHLQGNVLPHLKYAGSVFGGFYGLCLENVGVALNDTLLPKLGKQMLQEKAMSSLARLHSEGVLHGDIKLSNLCYDVKTSRLTIIDLGFSEQGASLKEIAREKSNLHFLFESLC